MRKLLLFLPMLLGGCITCTEVALLPEERAWLTAYQEGAQLTFRSNRGHFNTLTMLPRKEWHENSDCNFMESGRYQPIFSQIVLRSDVQYGRPGQSLVVTIRKNNPERPGYLMLEFAGLSYPMAIQAGKKGQELVQQVCTLTTTGQTYPAAYVFREGRNSTNYGNQRMRAFYWDKQAGLLRYELADGEIFELAAR